MKTLILTDEQLKTLHMAFTVVEGMWIFNKADRELKEKIFDLLEGDSDQDAFLDAYYKAKEHLEVMRDQPEAEEFVQAMDDIMGHAMDMYISDAEDLGCEIVQNAEVIEERSYFRGKADQLHEDIRALNDAGMSEAAGILMDHDENSGNLCYI